MSVRDKQAYKILCKHLAGLPDTGPVSRTDVLLWVDFHYYVVNLLEEQGLTFRGYTVRDKGWATLLVMKVVRGDLPLVAFFTERDTTGCIKVFFRKLANETLAWVPDKYS